MIQHYLPTNEEIVEAHKIRQMLILSVKDFLSIANIDAEVQIAGSAARDTWVRGKFDFDVFTITPQFKEAFEVVSKHYPNGKIKQGQLDIWNVMFAGHEVDFVFIPPTHERVATLKHNEFLLKRLTHELRIEAITGKAFLDGVGVLRPETGGVPSVAVEIAVVHCGSFAKVCKMWSIMTTPFLSDPAKKDRNLLACVHPKRWLQLQHFCRNYVMALKREQEVEIGTFTEEEYLKNHSGWTHLKFERRSDRATDFNTMLANCNAVLHELHGKFPEIKGECDAFVFEQTILSFKATPEKLPSTFTKVGPPIAMVVEAIIFKNKHGAVFLQNGKVCTIINREKEINVVELIRENVVKRMNNIISQPARRKPRQEKLLPLDKEIQ